MTRWTVVLVREGGGCSGTMLLEAETSVAAAERAVALAMTVDVAAPLRAGGFTPHVAAVIYGPSYDALHAFRPETNLGLLYSDRRPDEPA